MELITSGEDRSALKKVEDLARKLGLKISGNKPISTKEEKAKSIKLYDLMTEKANSGGIESIKDPVAWQREIREDKKLYGRDE